MAYKTSVQYVRFYTDGTAARKMDYAVPENKPATQAKPRTVKKKKIYVDPVAILSVMVAVCMLIVMAVGVSQLREAQREAAQMERYVIQLTREREALTQEYAASYDLESVEQTALALGMVPSDQVRQTRITVTPSQTAEEPTAWETIATFLTGLFA